MEIDVGMRAELLERERIEIEFANVARPFREIVECRLGKAFNLHELLHADKATQSPLVVYDFSCEVAADARHFSEKRGIHLVEREAFASAQLGGKA